MFKALFTVLLVCSLSACTTDDSQEPPYCVELGAKPDQPLLCNRSGLCTFDGQSCRTGTPPDAGSGGSAQ